MKRMQENRHICDTDCTVAFVMIALTRRLAIVILAAAASQAAAQQRDVLLEPMAIRDQFLLSNGFYFFIPEAAPTLAQGEWNVSLASADANTFVKSAWISHSLEGRTTRSRALETLSDPRFQSIDTLFLVDGQLHRTDLSIRGGIGRHLELGATVPISSVGGGWSDPLIEFAHRSMRIGNAGRESLRLNSETVYLRHSGRSYVRERGNGAAFGDIALTAKYELKALEDHNVRVAVTGAVELPTGDARTLDGSGSIDTGMQVVASRIRDRSAIHLSLGVLRLGRNASLGIKPQWLITDTVTMSHLVTDRSAVVAQLTVSESPFRQLGVAEFSRRAYQLSTGVQRRIGNLVVHVAFIENVISFENSADAGFAWGISRRF